MHLPPLVMRRIAARLGCRIVSVQRWASGVPGRPGVGYFILCPTHRAKVSLLDALAWHDAKHDLELREYALALVRELGTDPATLARAVHLLVRDGVRFLREPRETFQDAFLTLYYGAGDCDDHARLVLALLRIMGVPCRPRVLADRRATRAAGELVPKHVAAEAYVNGRWRWLETTVAGARFGEHPVDAKRRVGAGDRRDIECG